MKASTVLLVVVLFALALVACTGNNASDGADQSIPDIIVPGDPLAGADAYRAICSNCHGRDLQGVGGLGKQLVPGDFVVDMSEDELVAFIIIGRPRDHPDNTTGVDMLPRGGNPSLSDQSIHDIAAYLKAQN